jgi:hypothetical protein
VATPSIKGSAIAAHMDDLRALVESGRLGQDELELHLEAQDIRLLDEKIEPSLWYPVDSADRIANLLAAQRGTDPVRYGKDMGRRSMQMVLAQEGIRRFVAGALGRGDKAGPALVGLASLVFNFGRWSFEGESLSSFRIVMSEAAALPATSLHSVAGFIEALSESVLHRRIQVSGTRVDEDRVVWEGRPA